LSEIAVARAGMVVPLPEDVSLVAAAAVPVTLSTAHLLLVDGVRIRAGDGGLVHSASGGMGTALAALARRYGPTRLGRPLRCRH
jgi:NADPH2:quinone reductase